MCSRPKLRPAALPLLLLLNGLGCGATLAAGQSLLSERVAVSTVAGVASQSGSSDGIASSATFNSPISVAMNSVGDFAVVADETNHLIRAMFLPEGSVATLAGRRGITGITDGMGSNASFNAPVGVALTSGGSLALVTDSFSSTIRVINVTSGLVTTLTGQPGVTGFADGRGSSATFIRPSSVAVNAIGSRALVADSFGFVIRSVDVTSGIVTTLAGKALVSGSSDGTGTLATFLYPLGIALDAGGTFALVADSGNGLVRSINVTSGAVRTLAGQTGGASASDGTGTLATFTYPRSVALSSDGTVALVADSSANLIRGINLTSRRVTTLAGQLDVSGSSDGLGSSAKFYSPSGLAIDAGCTFALVADTANNLVRAMSVPPSPSQSATLSPSPTRTPSPTMTSSATRTLSSTLTPSPMPSPSSTGSLTQSPSLTGSLTQSPSLTGSLTQASTLSQTPSPSPSVRGSQGQTVSPSRTPSQVHTVDASLSASHTPSSSMSLTQSRGSSQSQTPSSSQVHSVDILLSTSPTLTSTMTRTPSGTGTNPDAANAPQSNYAATPLSSGAVAGIVIGAIIVLVLVALLAAFICVCCCPDVCGARCCFARRFCAHRRGGDFPLKSAPTSTTGSKSTSQAAQELVHIAPANGAAGNSATAATTITVVDNPLAHLPSGSN